MKITERGVDSVSEARPNHRPPKERVVDQEALKRDFYTIYEVADLMGFHHQTVRRMIKAGELPAKQFGRIWRIRKDDLKAFATPESKLDA